MRWSFRASVGLAAVALLVSGCAVGEPLTTDGVTLTGATLHGNVYSSVEGTTEYWWIYGGSEKYGLSTPHRTIAIHDEDPHSVSEPLTGLSPNTTYHFQLCARDGEETPPRTNCSVDHGFSTASAIGGSRIAYGGVADGSYEAFTMGPDGRGRRQLTSDPASDLEPYWAPDGNALVFTSDRDGDDEIYLMDPDGANVRRLTQNTASDFSPSWSHVGGKIAFVSDRDGNPNGDPRYEIYKMNTDGSAQTRLTVNEGGLNYMPAWSPDGTKIAFTSDRGHGSTTAVYVMNADGSNQTRLTDDTAVEQAPAWSPDGSKIAYHSFRDGNYEIYVMNADGTDKRRLTDDPVYDFDPEWSPDGRKIVFSCYDNGPGACVMDADGSDRVRIAGGSLSDQATPSSWGPPPQAAAAGH